MIVIVQQQQQRAQRCGRRNVRFPSVRTLHLHIKHIIEVEIFWGRARTDRADVIRKARAFRNIEIKGQWERNAHKLEPLDQMAYLFSN